MPTLSNPNNNSHTHRLLQAHGLPVVLLVRWLLRLLSLLLLVPECSSSCRCINIHCCCPHVQQCLCCLIHSTCTCTTIQPTLLSSCDASRHHHTRTRDATAATGSSSKRGPGPLERLLLACRALARNTT